MFQQKISAHLILYVLENLTKPRLQMSLAKQDLDQLGPGSILISDKIALNTDCHSSCHFLAHQIRISAFHLYMYLQILSHLYYLTQDRIKIT